MVTYGHTIRWITLFSCENQNPQILRSSDVCKYIIHVSKVYIESVDHTTDFLWTYFDQQR